MQVGPTPKRSSRSDSEPATGPITSGALQHGGECIKFVGKQRRKPQHQRYGSDVGVQRKRRLPIT
jgi:hypothetical protein